MEISFRQAVNLSRNEGITMKRLAVVAERLAVPGGISRPLVRIRIAVESVCVDCFALDRWQKVRVKHGAHVDIANGSYHSSCRYIAKN